MVKIIVDIAVADIINDFIETSNYFGYYPKLVVVTYNPDSVTRYKAIFNLRGLPSHQLLRSLSLRFNKVIITVKDELNVFIEVFDNCLPL